MAGDQLATQQHLQSSAQPTRLHRNIPKAQEAIYGFLLEIVKTWTADDVLTEFKQLFIHHADTVSSNTLPHLFEIVFSNQEQEFRNTLKRSCYILINNWDITRNHKAIHQLIELFSDPVLEKSTISPTLKRLRAWLKNFVASQDFRELKLFAARYEEQEKVHWADRYTSYLLVSQYTNHDNSIEQRQAARNLSRKLKEKFKFDLAMYTALSQGNRSVQRSLKNPTGLGDEVLNLIKRIVAKRGFFNYSNLARIFLNQIQTLNYASFKSSLLEYLLFSLENSDFATILRVHLSEKLQDLYPERNDKLVDDALVLRTANRIIEFLTTENHEDPSQLFVLLLSHSNPTTLVIVLLKLILICGHARTHLEVHIADLIRHYQQYSEEDSRWVINFFEIFNVTMTIFTENVEYNLVTMPSAAPSYSGWETCRIFSQLRHRPLISTVPNQTPDIAQAN
jgi:hypothetical protein